MNELTTFAALLGVQPVEYGTKYYAIQYQSYHWTYVGWIRYPVLNSRPHEWVEEHMPLLVNWRAQGCPLPINS